MLSETLETSEGPRRGQTPAAVTVSECNALRTVGRTQYGSARGHEQGRGPQDELAVRSLLRGHSVRLTSFATKRARRGGRPSEGSLTEPPATTASKV